MLKLGSPSGLRTTRVFSSIITCEVDNQIKYFLFKFNSSDLDGS